MTQYVVRAGESWESIAGKLTGNQRNFLEIAGANPNVYMLAPGMVINIPDVFPENPVVNVTPEMQKAGYATSSQIADWYANPDNVGKMPGIGGVAGGVSGGGTTTNQFWTLPIGQTAEGRQRETTPAIKGGYKQGWQPAMLANAPGLNPVNIAQQPPWKIPALQVQKTAEGGQRQFYTGQPTFQTTQEVLQRPGYVQPAPIMPLQNPLGQSLMPILQQALQPRYSYRTPQIAPTSATQTTPYSYTATAPVAPAMTSTGQVGEPSEADMLAVYNGTASPEVEARVAQFFGVAAPTVPTTPAPITQPANVSYLYGNPFYAGGAGPEYAPKSEWGTLIFPQIYQNANDYAELLTSEPLQNSGLLNGLFNWRAGW